MKSYLLLALLIGMAIPCQAEWRERRGALTEMHSMGEFRIFYSLSGQDALPNSADANVNGAPDYVERVASELAAARDLYDRQLQLVHPLKSPRYNDQAEFIDVHLLSFPLTSSGAKHGIAYDELSSFDRARERGRKTKVLVMDLSNDLPARNPTPAHELFHLYQNGYTLFKNRWFTEGTARWAESLDKKASAGAGQLPSSPSEVNDLFRKTYQAASFWTAVVNRMDPAGGGRAFIRPFFEQLGRMDDAAGAKTGQGVTKWTEKQQMSPANDAYIWKALQDTLAQSAFRQRRDADIQSLIDMTL
jgi:hypothetical protein